jgi:hypothetical protein
MIDTTRKYATETPLHVSIGRQKLHRRTMSNRLRTASLTFRHRTALEQHLLRSEGHCHDVRIYLRAYRKHRTSCQARVSYRFLSQRKCHEIPILECTKKKRPNSLNCEPTSIESALRLLSAPSVRFWQRTAICPVSLWALVIELHPLNWAYAQAVRRISDKVTMKESVCVYVCVCVCENLLRNW